MRKIFDLYNLNKFHNQGITGKGITTAILDTGIYPHKDLSGNILEFHDVINYRITPYDDNSHGTHVSGIICSTGHSARAYTGVAPDSKIIAVKVLDQSGHGTPEKIISGIEWILKNKEKYNIKIVNISIGTRVYSCSDETSSLVQAVDHMWDSGLTVLVSAGNNGPDYHTITTPGISRKVITVGSCQWNNYKIKDSRALFSGKGPTLCNILKPDIVAPGDNITSCAPRNIYTTKSGTSMSTPVVSGAAALLLSFNNEISNSNFKNLLHLSAKDIGLDRFTQGYGRLDIEKLFILANPVL